MDKLTDYIRWVGSLDFQSYPFREADALVLCIISYYDLSPLFEKNDKVYVRDCLPMIESGEAKLRITGGDMGQGEIFEAAVRSRRYGGLALCDYRDLIREEPALQFSAVTFRDEDRFGFIAYRGTDATLAGWKEDFMISFTKTEAQHLALEYAEEQIRSGGAANWYIGGHSKGGNQALYAACMLSQEAWDQITRVYLLDGPGLCPDVMDITLVYRIDAKTTRIIPEFDVVGKLFEPKITDTRIVKCDAEGILQHALPFWLLDHGDLAETDKNDPLSLWLNETMDNWIGGIPQEERPVFIDEFFDALYAGGVKTLDDMDFDAIYAALVSLSGKSETTKQALSELPKRVIFDDVLEDAKTKGILQWAKTSPIARALLLILCGIGTILASAKVLDIAAMTLAISLALLQTVLTVRRLVKNQWKLDGLRERFLLTILLIALCVVIFIKEQATFLLGSVIFGILFLAAGYISGENFAREKHDRFLHILYLAEAILSFLFGVSFLVIPEATVYAYALAVGIIMIADGCLRLGRLFLLWRQKNKHNRKSV